MNTLAYFFTTKFTIIFIAVSPIDMPARVPFRLKKWLKDLNTSTWEPAIDLLRPMRVGQSGIPIPAFHVVGAMVGAI